MGGLTPPPSMAQRRLAPTVPAVEGWKREAREAACVRQLYGDGCSVSMTAPLSRGLSETTTPTRWSRMCGRDDRASAAAVAASARRRAMTRARVDAVDARWIWAPPGRCWRPTRRACSVRSTAWWWRGAVGAARCPVHARLRGTGRLAGLPRVEVGGHPTGAHRLAPRGRDHRPGRGRTRR